MNGGLLSLLLICAFCNVFGSKATDEPNQTNDKGVCSPNPCANGGSCMNENNDFKCYCKRGFMGELCQIDIDECASNPCKNGGSCHDDIGKYICICENGYRGDRCQRKYKIDSTLKGLLYFDLISFLITASFVLMCIQYMRNRDAENTFEPNSASDREETRQQHAEEHINKRREEHLREYDEMAQKVETNEYSILSITDIPWPSENDEDDD